MPIENDPTYDHNAPMIGQQTRKHVTGMISKLCEKLLHVPREALGIYASPRVQCILKGAWHSVYLKDVPELAGKGTVVIFIEKVGVVDQIKHVIDMHGIAFVNTQGHFAEYPKRLVSAIIEKGGYVAILTDFDCAGINIAEKVIEEVIASLGPDGLRKR